MRRSIGITGGSAGFRALNVRRTLISFTLIFLPLIAQAATPFDPVGDVSGWKTFEDSAGWTIKYPPDWQVSSCRKCSGPIDRYQFVTFHDPSISELIVIESLGDKPADQSIENWVNDVKRKMVLTPQLNQEWIVLHGLRVLKVRNRNPDSSESENVYIINNSKTFLIRASDIRNRRFYRVYQQILSTFGFMGR
jgi:hypothetical protein